MTCKGKRAVVNISLSVLVISAILTIIQKLKGNKKSSSKNMGEIKAADQFEVLQLTGNGKYPTKSCLFFCESQEVMSMLPAGS